MDMDIEALDYLLDNHFELDAKTLADLVTFGRLEVETRDVEPWADLLSEVLRRGELDREAVIWLTTLYNTYDSFSSAWNCFQRWPSPAHWDAAPDREEARNYPIMQERRNLFGGRVNLRHHSYATMVGAGTQAEWLARPLQLDSPGRDFERLTAQMRTVTQVGRQAAYEWAEFASKVAGFPVDSEDGQLWESSGPRRSLERIYGNDNPTQEWLDKVAQECKNHLAEQGVHLSWFDFETIICDFEVGRRGRYFPGRHLQALREEIGEIEDVASRLMLNHCFRTVVPEPWCDIPAGIDKSKLAVYRDTGKLVTDPWW